LTIGLISCQEERQSLDGHWVSKEFFEGKPFFTLDIYEKDSFLLINKNSLASSHGFYSIEKNHSRFGMECMGYVLFLDGDSLHSYDEPNSYMEPDSFNLDSCSHKNGTHYNSVLVRADPNSTFYKSLFLNRLVEFDLPDEIHGLIQSKPKTKFLDLTIGTPLDSVYSGDTTVFQADDVYLSKRDIPPFVIRRAAGYSENQKQDLVIRLNADKGISNDYLKSFFPKNDTLPLWRTYLNRDKTELLYKPL
jgi:hypothetical protein